MYNDNEKASSTSGLGLVDTQTLASKRKELILKLRVIKAKLSTGKAGDPQLVQLEQKYFESCVARNNSLKLGSHTDSRPSDSWKMY